MKGTTASEGEPSVGAVADEPAMAGIAGGEEEWALPNACVFKLRPTASIYILSNDTYHGPSESLQILRAGPILGTIWEP